MMVNTTALLLPLVEDVVFPNDSSITTNWTSLPLGCAFWKLPNHPLFQIANTALLLGLMTPQWKHGVLFLHLSFVLGFLLLSVWSWVILCAPDYFSWNFAFMIINIIQTLILLYDIKPIKFEEGLEKLYSSKFQPMNVSRRLFKKLTDDNFCFVSHLHEGDAYAVQGITKTDRLGLLVSGKMKVYNHHNLLHLIHQMEFIDSPEFESSVTGDEKYQVSIHAATTCMYIYWPRQSLEYLLMKEPFLAYILNTMMGRDITNKLYALNNRTKESEDVDSHGDIRLPKESFKMRGRTYDLRRTLAQVSSQSCLPGRPAPRANINNLLLEEESEDIDGPYSVLEEEVDLMSQPRSSIQSFHSGLQFNVPSYTA